MGAEAFGPISGRAEIGRRNQNHTQPILTARVAYWTSGHGNRKEV